MYDAPLYWNEFKNQVPSKANESLTFQGVAVRSPAPHIATKWAKSGNSLDKRVKISSIVQHVYNRLSSICLQNTFPVYGLVTYFLSEFEFLGDGVWKWGTKNGAE